MRAEGGGIRADIFHSKPHSVFVVLGGFICCIMKRKINFKRESCRTHSMILFIQENVHMYM